MSESTVGPWHRDPNELVRVHPGGPRIPAPTDEPLPPDPDGDDAEGPDRDEYRHDRPETIDGGAMPVTARNPNEDGEKDDLSQESAQVEGLLTEIDHVAIAVHDLGDAIDYYRETFGAVVDHREVVESDGVEEALLKVAESYIQLLTPTRDDSPVAKYLEKKGEGLHHIGYRVADCGAALEAVKAQGGRVIDEAPRPGSRGTTVAFVHPKTAFGTLIELVQE
jgi:methylmalonyl-CoA/ethylmalonyl-CoA epimerase